MPPEFAGIGKVLAEWTSTVWNLLFRGETMDTARRGTPEVVEVT